MISLLVECGADLDSREDGGGTPLHLASENPEAFEVMEMLLRLGAQVNAKDSNGATALDTALMRGDEDKIALLRSYGGLRGVDA